MQLSGLADAGLDLVVPFDPRPVSALPGLAALAGHRRGVLVGNTRALWPRFLAACRADPALRACADPLDLHVERALAAAAGDATVLLGHRPDAAGAYLPLQRLAAAIGVGALSPTHLVVHPRHGPWIALRGVLLDDGPPPPPAPPPAPPPCRCADGCQPAFEAALAGGGWRAWLAVRDACPVGRASRYGEDQLRYHYARDRAPLDGTADDT